MSATRPVNTPRHTSGLLRRSLRTGALLGTSAAVLLLTSGPVSAEPAEGWPVAPEVPVAQILTLVLLIPVGLAVVLAVLFGLPGLAADRSQKSSSNVPATWMGGPKEGTDTLPEGSSASDDTGSDARGGASARW